MSLETKVTELVEASNALTLKAEQIINEAEGLLEGQTWQDVTGGRAEGVVYTNTSNKPICVAATWANTDGSRNAFAIDVDAVSSAMLISPLGLNGTAQISWLSAIVPPGSTYKIYASSGVNGGSLSTVQELI